MNKTGSIMAAVLTTALFAACSGTAPLYKNPDAPVEKRVEDLLKRMTLEEKVGQMNQYTGQNIAVDGGYTCV